MKTTPKHPSERLLVLRSFFAGTALAAPFALLVAFAQPQAAEEVAFVPPAPPPAVARVQSEAQPLPQRPHHRRVCPHREAMLRRMAEEARAQQSPDLNARLPVVSVSETYVYR